MEKAETRKKQQSWNNERTAKLGTNPKEYRRQLRESLDQGFYVAVSSKKKIRTLHLLGECYLCSTTRLSLSWGLVCPVVTLFDQACKWCAKSGDMNQKSQDSLRGRKQRPESVDAPIVVALSWTRAARGRDHGRSSLHVASVDACRPSPLARGSIDGWSPKEDTSWKTFMSLVSTCYHQMCSTVRFQ